ncbi:MAG: hypothetical protein ABI557_14970, partial [Aureliella sp.]
VPASKIRCFTTIQSVAADPRTAIENLKSETKLIAEALAAIGLPENALNLTTTRILEWEKKPRGQNFYYPSHTNGLSPKADFQSYTAIAHASFDVSLDGVALDDLTLHPYEICQRLRGHTVFESREIIVLFVGEIDANQIANARKKAYNEAFDDAKTFASISDRSLGKIAALTPETDGRWRYWSGLAYGYWSDENSDANPLTQFTPAENEIFGSDPLKLSRNITIELRFNIE